MKANCIIWSNNSIFLAFFSDISVFFGFQMKLYHIMNKNLDPNILIFHNFFKHHEFQYSRGFIEVYPMRIIIHVGSNMELTIWFRNKWYNHRDIPNYWVRLLHMFIECSNEIFYQKLERKCWSIIKKCAEFGKDLIDICC